MSLTYSTLKTQILADGHRTDLSDSKAADFVRQAEGVIARRLRCAEMLTRATIDETDRVSSGIYTLPTNCLEVAQIWTSDDRELTKIGLSELRKYSASIDPKFFCPLSSSEIEFRGVPGTDAELEALYFARPTALSGASDTNDILTNHETIYLHAGLSALHTYSQDLELAQVAAGIAEAAIETLNEQAGRLLAGGRAEGFYNLSSFGSY